MVSTNVNHSTRSISVERVVWYSDAVVGIMQTFLAALLVDSLADLALATQGSNKPPDTVVAEWIGDQGSKFLSHCVVFFMLIYLWRRHHELYRRPDHPHHAAARHVDGRNPAGGHRHAHQRGARPAHRSATGEGRKTRPRNKGQREGKVIRNRARDTTLRAAARA